MCRAKGRFLMVVDENQKRMMMLFVVAISGRNRFTLRGTVCFGLIWNMFGSRIGLQSNAQHHSVPLIG